jgi:hypothetical protein
MIWLRRLRNAILPIIVLLGALPMVFPVTPLDTVIEALIGGTWVNITSDVLGEGANTKIKLHRGRDDTFGTAQPSSATMELKNPAGKYSPRNPRSPYYGLIGKNTPVRIYVRPHWTSGSGMDDSDTFTRTIASGWGSSNGGNAYGMIGAGAPINGTDWSTDGSSGILSIPVAGGYRWSSIDQLVLEDMNVSAVADTVINTVVTSNIEVCGLMIRKSAVGYYLGRLNIAPGGAMTAKIYVNDTLQIATASVGTFTWTGQPIGCRMQIIGTTISYKVWDAAGAEPTAWTLEVENKALLQPGGVGFRSGIAAGNTNTKPILFYWDNIVVTTILTRINGEVAQWPIKWDKTGKDVRAAITVSGVTRRMNQGNKTPRSPLSRAVLADNPVAYWTLDDGVSALVGSSLVPNTNMTFDTIGIKFGQIDGPAGAPNKLPNAVVQTLSRPGGEALVAHITGATGNAWSVEGIINSVPNITGTSSYTPISWQTTGTIWAMTTYQDPSTSTYNVIVSGHTYDGVTNLSLVVSYPLLNSQWHTFKVACSYAAGNSVAELFIDGNSLGTASAGFTTGNLTTVNILQSPNTAVVSGSTGHIAVYSGISIPSHYLAMIGYQGESITARLDRLAVQDSIPILYFDDGTSQALTAQRTAKLPELLQDIQAADLGIVTDTRNSRSITYRAINSLYNQPPVTMNYAGHEPSEVPIPLDDDSKTWNDVTVQRNNGATFRVTQASGVLNTQTPPNGVGTYDRGTFTSHVALDTTLPHVGYQILRIGTCDESRFPSITCNMARSELTGNHPTSAALASLDIGDIVGMYNLPVWLPPETVTGVIQGYNETLSNFEWSIEFVTTPASVYTTGVYDSTATRYASADSTLATGYNTTDTTLSINFTSTRWVRAADDAGSLPFDIMVAGEKMTVTAVANTTSPQSFTVTRSVNGIVKNQLANTPVTVVLEAYYAF